MAQQLQGHKRAKSTAFKALDPHKHDSRSYFEYWQGLKQNSVQNMPQSIYEAQSASSFQSFSKSANIKLWGTLPSTLWPTGQQNKQDFTLTKP